MPSNLDRLFASAAGSSTPSKVSTSSNAEANYDPNQPGAVALPGGYTRLPSGVVLDASGKPCKQCTSGSAWKSMLKATKPPTTPAPTVAVATESTLSDCPPDVDELGRNTWSMLHTMAATYPETASSSTQATMRSFISTFSQLYPCGTCAEDFRGWMKQPGNEPRVRGQDDLGTWMCEAHNAVNVKLGKKEFDCSLWKERWRDGWRDGRCD